MSLENVESYVVCWRWYIDTAKHVAKFTNIHEIQMIIDG